ncbi:MAG: DUF4129 domain-containing protein [Rhodoglobus sp.]
MTLTILSISAPVVMPRWLVSAVPVDPESDEATNWLIDELSKAPYQAAKPTLFDRISKSFLDWLNSLTVGDGSAIPPLAFVALIALVIIAVIAAILVYGIPRLNRKSRHEAILFGEADYRTSAQLRNAAEKAAAQEDFTSAVADMFRAIARGLSERTLVTMTPGTTAHGFAVRAANALPECGTDLANGANTFDLIRYGSAPADRSQYEQLRALEARVRATRPNLVEATS